MMQKVSSLWRIGALILLGFSLGVFVTIKFITPPSQDIQIGNIKIKGQNNTVTDAVTIHKHNESDSSKNKSRFKIFNRNE